MADPFECGGHDPWVVEKEWHNGCMTVSSVDAHAQAVHLEIHELVRQLNTHLGPTLVAALAGSKDTKLPHKWAKPAGPRPRPTTEARLQVAYRLWTTIATSEGGHVARAWFLGANPLLGEETPLTAIREDRHREVLGAAEAFVTGQFAS